MRLAYLITMTAAILVFFSCNKNRIKSSVVAELTIDQVKSSEVIFNTKSNGDSEIEITLGENYVDVIESGEEMWFSFNAEAGMLYKVSWKDSWWEEYTAGSIYVTGYEADKSTVYFNEERLIQMHGAPKVISVENDGLVYVKVRGYRNEISGSFAINVDKLNAAESTNLYCDSTLSSIVSAGEVQVYQMQVVKDSLYTVSIEGSQFIGAYGDQVSVKVSALREGLNESYFLDELARAPMYNGTPNIQSFTALETETIYLPVMGAYWWSPRAVSLSLACQ